MPNAKCFVIMPFSKTSPSHNEKYWNSHFAYLKSLIETNETINAYRSSPLRGNILDDIIKNLIYDDIVIADLTDKNANVFWELGIRYSFRRPTITIAQLGTKLPFDIAQIHHYWYTPIRARNTEFEEKLKIAIRDCLQNVEKIDNPVWQAISGQGTLYERIHRDESLRRLEGLLWELDFNKYILWGESTSAKYALEYRQIWIPISDRFIMRALELLVTTRYLEENESFYNDLQRYFDFFRQMSHKLEAMIAFPLAASTENAEWFLGNAKIAGQELETFKQRVITALDKLKNVL